MSALDETGPMWMDCPDDQGGRVLRPGWCHVSEDGCRVTMTLMTDPEDIAFWFPSFHPATVPAGGSEQGSSE